MLSMTNELSAEAREALLNTAPRRGARMPVHLKAATADELWAHELMGLQGGLTEKGLKVRAKLMAAALEEAFGS